MALKEKIAAGEAVFGVVGLGYVGLPLAAEMGEAGHRVVGIDVSADVCERINAGESHIRDIPDERVRTLVESGLLAATTDYSALAEADAVAICVPTPLNEMKEPDTSFIVAAARELTPYLHADMLVTLESTTYPGTTTEILQPILEGSGLSVGDELYLAFSPERVDPGNQTFNTANTPKVVGGVTPESTEVARAMYERFVGTVVPVSTPEVAEMTKLLENIFRCVNIALVNEMAMLSERMDVDIWEVVEAAQTKPFGFMPFYPGPGLGGHCIPIDPYYLSWKAREFDFHTRFIDLAGQTNDGMPDYVVRRLTDALNAQGKALSSANVLLLGVAYKKDIDDVRESPAFRLIELLDGRTKSLDYHDPNVPSVHAVGAERMSVDLTNDLLEKTDAAVLVTDHSDVDYEAIVSTVPLVLDTRNALKEFTDENVVRL